MRSSAAADEVVVEALAAAAGIAVQNADLYEQARLRQQWLEASAEIRAELLSGASDQDALRLIAQRTMELTRSDYAVIVLGPDPDTAEFVVKAQCGEDEIDLLGYRTGPRHPLLSGVVEGGAVVLTELSEQMLEVSGFPVAALRADGGGADALTGLGHRGAGGAAAGRARRRSSRGRCRC